MKSLKLMLDFERLKKKGYQIEEEVIKDKAGNYICEKFETVKVVGHNVRDLNRNFIFKADETIGKEPRWFELPYEDVIDQILIRQVQEIGYERIEYLNNLQEYYQVIEEDDDEEYDEIINERGVLEDTIPKLYKLIEVEVKEREVHFITYACDYYNTYHVLTEFLSCEIENFCEKEYWLTAFIDKKGE